LGLGDPGDDAELLLLAIPFGLVQALAFADLRTDALPPL
jgi:hypothetical protein